MNTITEASQLVKRQRRKFGPKHFDKYEKGAAIRAEVRYDDDCGNGHNTFTITGEIYKPGARDFLAGGCIHDEVAEAFPELAPLIKWHLCSSDGPMHYPGNVLFLAGDKDCWGHVKGEPINFRTVIQFGENPIKYNPKGGEKFIAFLRAAHPLYDFEVIGLDHENRPGDNYKFDPKYTFGGYASRWHECPFDSEKEALNFLKALQTCNPQYISRPTGLGEGKARQLDAARSSAIWPEATDEELCAPDLKEKLEARLPALLEAFRHDVEALGFTW